MLVLRASGNTWRIMDAPLRWERRLSGGFEDWRIMDAPLQET
jgi:hypothetical protein